ncbi:TetR/AcrR family transcriptional regulator [Rhodococcus sp. 05-2254-5]|uniref:TetR/AcrR family transcriptional regulator n=1 Tax=Nocardiaceae TaxID=85025 RepID=UPI00050C6583|nr:MULTISPECIES: TetR family transcriptional regulator [Rhodococcus]OZE18709.1 TetR/AcrR family transcriptional regulator [Rhodococcus sp. 05-2254-6]OZE39784.1 TetR/AcrR family transcriptional regulator [Rhodococcus sp. 05-2254-5]OZE60919.1 TetR/AcrR family transcriptional regulator [Rhodococcus sp. 05-2254-1]OZE97179.1 TetR/AcrR family transcriptional regulator [Rhodococcus sp. 15-1154-1]OZE97831.1 TetR/AcrR family transcriptional regulator [Rhodococcus sp. 15-2388-1-1a]
MATEERTTQILDAVERLLARGGLDAVTMRAAAAEAGVSLRLVQYYGNSKDELLHSALSRLSRRSVERWQHASADPNPSIEEFLLEALPTDDASRSLHRVGVSLELLSITTESLVADAYRAHLTAIHDHLTDLCHTRSPGISGRRATDLATECMAFMHGLGSLVMAGHTTQQQARICITDFVARLK